MQRRLSVISFCINVGPRVDEVFRDLGVAAPVQRRLAVISFCIDIRASVDELCALRIRPASTAMSLRSIRRTFI